MESHSSGITARWGVISPLLANSSLHVLERVWTAWAASLGILIWYADDFVTICQRRQGAEKALQVIQQTLGKLKHTSPSHENTTRGYGARRV